MQFDPRQITLFDLWEPRPIIRPVDPNGRTVQNPDEVFQRDFGNDLKAEIQIHQHTDGLWMWALSLKTRQGGRSYQVGAKWGKFAESRRDALIFVRQELDATYAGRRSCAPSSEELQSIRLWIAAFP